MKLIFGAKINFNPECFGDVQLQPNVLEQRNVRVNVHEQVEVTAFRIQTFCH